MIPENFKKLYSREQIEKQINVLSKDIDKWITSGEENERDVLAIPVMRGGLYFFADLSRAVKNSLECNPIQSWAYQGEENTAIPSGVTLKLNDLPVGGRRILIIDDICDSGKTLNAIQKSFLDRGAKEVVAAVLIQRGDAEPTIQPKWVGFHYEGPEWFVGYGMDDGGRWRNLPEIYIIE